MADLALTIRQPWEWAIEHGKPVENRSWNMKYRGELYLHAGARSRWDPDGAASPLVQAAWSRYLREVPGWPDLPESDVILGRETTLMSFGAVAAVAQVTGCHHDDDCAGTCSPWAARGQFHIELADVRSFRLPRPCRGALGLWRLT